MRLQLLEAAQMAKFEASSAFDCSFDVGEQRLWQDFVRYADFWTDSVRTL
jgi:hypothetical protein